MDFSCGVKGCKSHWSETSGVNGRLLFRAMSPKCTASKFGLRICDQGHGWPLENTIRQGRSFGVPMTWEVSMSPPSIQVLLDHDSRLKKRWEACVGFNAVFFAWKLGDDLTNVGLKAKNWYRCYVLVPSTSWSSASQVSCLLSVKEWPTRAKQSALLLFSS